LLGEAGVGVSQENVEIARRAITAMLSQPPDMETVGQVMHPDHVLTTNWGVGEAEHRGMQGALAALAEMGAVWDSWQQQLERVLDAGDGSVVALLRFRGRGRESAVPVESPWAMVVTLQDARIVTSRVFLSHDEALEAADVSS
jgi:ketosteroid isomerase-like protein